MTNKVFPYRFQIRQHIDYDKWLDQKGVPLRPGRMDHIKQGEESWFLRFQCPCMEPNALDVILNTRCPNQEPYYLFYEDEQGFVSINQIINTPCGCQFWIKKGEIIGYQKTK